MSPEDEIVIRVRSLTKRYPLYRKKTDRLREALSPAGAVLHTEKEALSGVSFTVRRGECIGIIGLNGSGKSTLLKILTGVVSESGGTAEVKGHTASLLELGAGLNPEYTAVENVFLSLALMGYTEREAQDKLPAILEFADIGSYAEQPVRTYSSGMFVRLAFSIAMSAEPEILMIDEALSVGDIFFQQKCWRRLRELRDRCTVLMVSHDLTALTKFCGRILLLHQGVLRFDGSPGEAVAEYYKVRQGFLEEWEDSAAIRKMPGTKDVLPFRMTRDGQLSGRMEAVITEFYYDIDGDPFREWCRAGQEIHVVLKVESGRRMENLIVGYQVLDRYGTEVFGETSITAEGISRDTVLERGVHRIAYSFRWPEIREGDYLITLGIGSGDEVLRQTEQCWVNRAIHLVNSTGGKVIYGVFNGSMRDFAICGD